MNNLENKKSYKISIEVCMKEDIAEDWFEEFVTDSLTYLADVKDIKIKSD